MTELSSKNLENLSKKLDTKTNSFQCYKHANKSLLPELTNLQQTRSEIQNFIETSIGKTFALFSYKKGKFGERKLRDCVESKHRKVIETEKLKKSTFSRLKGFLPRENSKSY